MLAGSGRTPDPLSISEKEKRCSMRKRNVTITVRCTEDERQRIYDKARQHNLKLSDYVLRSALGKKIVVANGLDEVVKQQKAIGNNINQLTRLANEGRIKAVQLDEVQATLRKIYEQLSEIVKAVK